MLKACNFNSMLTTVVVLMLFATITTNGQTRYDDRILFQNANEKFECAYPATWEINTAAKGKRLAIRNRDTVKLGVISVKVEKTTETPSDFAKYAPKLGKTIADSARKRCGSATLVKEGWTKLSGVPAYMTSITYDIKNPTLDATIANIQVTCVRDGYYYGLNFESPIASFDENYADFAVVLATFLFR